MARGKVTPQGKRVVQSEPDSDKARQDRLRTILVDSGVILQSENQNALADQPDGKNDHSESDAVSPEWLDAWNGTTMVQNELAQTPEGVTSDLNASISSQNPLQSTLSVESMIPALDNNSSSTKPAVALNGHSCETPGCIAHNQRSVDVDTFTFSFRVHFTPVVKKKVQLSGFENLLDHATESVGRKVQQLIRESRKKTGKDGFPSDRIVDIDTSLNFARTLEDEKREIDAMSEEQAQKELELLLRKMALLKSRSQG